jgi:aryl-alcohol dehydrogenase-like predicted oxidoreductase
MQYRRLGSSGLKVSEIALGSWLTYGDYVEDRIAAECVMKAVELGVNMFDTANSYADGAAERVLGRALSGVPRDEYVIATKVFFPMGSGPTSRGLSRKHVIEQCHASLRRLGTGHIDIYQCHRDDPDVPLDETLGALDDLVRQGLVLYVGVSEWPAALLRRAVVRQRERGLDPVVSHSPEYSLLCRGIERELLSVCSELGLGVVAYQALAQGILTGRYRAREAPAPGSRAADRDHGQWMRELMGDEVLDAVEKLKVVAAEAGLTHGTARDRVGTSPPRGLERNRRSLQLRTACRERCRKRHQARP